MRICTWIIVEDTLLVLHDQEAIRQWAGGGQRLSDGDGWPRGQPNVGRHCPRFNSWLLNQVLPGDWTKLGDTDSVW